MAITRGGRRATFWALACLVAAVAAYWRLETLERRPLWFDERWTARIVAGAPDLPALWKVAALDNYQHPPLGYAAAWLAAAGDPSPARLRTPSLLAGLASIALLGAITSLLFGRTAALLAALLASISVYHVDFSQDARPYMLGVAFTTAMYGALLAILAGRTRRWLAVLGFAALGSAYTYHLALAHVAVVGGIVVLHAVALARRGDARGARAFGWAAAATFAGAALLYAPQVPNLRGFLHAPGLSPNHRLDVTPAFLMALFGRWGSGDAWTAWVYAGMLAIGAGRLAARRDLGALAIAGWATAPFAPFALLPFSKYFDIRFLISALPVFFLLAGAGVDGLALAAAHLAGRRGDRARTLVTALLVALFAVPAVRLYAVFRTSAQRCGEVVHRPEILEADGRLCADHLLLTSIVPEQQWILKSLQPEIEIDAARLDDYVGAYRFETGPPLAIARNGDRLFIEIEGQLGYELLPDASDRFHYRVLSGRRVYFERDATGRVTALTLDRRGEQARAHRD